MIQGEKYKVLLGNNLDLLPTLEANSVDSIVTDPPYELGFMGKKWDNTGIAYNVELWKECLRVLKPGGHLLSFGGTRTWHRIAVAIEDAGFEVRDSIAWMYGAGFPKSLNYGKNDLFCQCSVEWFYGTGEPQTEHDLRPLQSSDLSQTLNLEDESREVLQPKMPQQGSSSTKGAKPKEGYEIGEEPVLEGRSDLQETQGKLFGGQIHSSARVGETDGSERRLHNGASPSNGGMDRAIIDSNRSGQSQRPQSKQQSKRESGTLPDQRGSQTRRSGEICNRCGKQNWQGWGTALKPAFEPIIVARKPLIGTVAENVLTYGTGGLNIDGSRIAGQVSSVPQWSRSQSNAPFDAASRNGEMSEPHAAGRWPANVILDEYTAGLLDEQSGIRPGGTFPAKRGQAVNTSFASGQETVGGQRSMGDSGGASRFFYVAKASKRDRNEGLEELPEVRAGGMSATIEGSMLTGSGNERTTTRQNFHPTVKPTALMEYLIKLVTPPNGLVLDPFTGSGSTGKAAILSGFRFLGIEMTEEYFPIIEGRLRHAETQGKENEGLF